MLERTIGGYKILIEKRRNDFVYYVPKLNIKLRNQDKGSGLRKVFEEVQIKVEQLNDKKVEVPEGDLKGNFHGDLQGELFQLNNFLNKFGYYANTDYLTTPEVDQLKQIAQTFNTKNVLSSKDKKLINDQISKILIQPTILPANRAWLMSGLIMKTDHMNKYSHLIEQAYISLMRLEFISVIMILTPVVEGILRSLIHYDYKDKWINDEKLINNICSLDYKHNAYNMTHPYMFDEYVRCFVNIFRNVFFNDHKLSDENLYFNRHYILHLMGDGNFYSRNNAIKLIMLIDLLAYIVSSHTGQNKSFRKSREDSDYQIRFKYYVSQIMQFEELAVQMEIMKEHENYKNPL